MAEGENPTRRYKWFRPRQAALGNVYSGQGANFSVAGLYNDSTGAYLLVVRSLRLATFQGTSATFATYYLNGKLTTNDGTILPMVTGESKLSGLVFSDNVAAINPAQGYIFNGPINADSFWEHQFPIAVIQPGWTFVAINTQTGNDLSFSVVWEAIYPDELDFFYY